MRGWTLVDPRHAWMAIGRSTPCVDGRGWNEGAEPADKPGSVVDSHSSRRRVTAALEQPTRTRRGQRHEVPIWSCSRWGLPYRSVTGLAVRSYRTISPLPVCLRRLRRYLSVALIRRLAPPRRYLAPCPMEPGLSSAPRCTEMHRDDATVWPTPPSLLSHVRRRCAARSGFRSYRDPSPQSPVPSPSSRVSPRNTPSGPKRRSWIQPRPSPSTATMVLARVP